MSGAALPYYKKFPRDFLEGTIGMSLEEKGAYAIVLDLIYMRNGSLPDDPQYIAGQLGCSVRKWNSIKNKLVEMGELCVQGGFMEPKMVSVFEKLSGRKSLSSSVRLAVLERDGWRCVYCETEDGPFHVDHILPVSKGGLDELENLACSCATCNLSKGAKLLDEWEGYDA